MLALYGGVAASSKGGLNNSDLTGTVVDSGDGVTHVIPIVSELLDTGRWVCDRDVYQAYPAGRARDHEIYRIGA